MVVGETDVERNPWTSLEYAEDVDESLEDVSLLPADQPRLMFHRAWVERLLDQLRGPSVHDCCPRFRFLRHPWVPSHLSSLAFAILLFVIFALVLVSTIKNLFDPDKYQLPWRSYCALSPEFPPVSPALESLPPVGLFIGVMSTAAGFQRRQLIRSTWASHPRSRGGVDGKSGLEGTSRTVVRFIVGAPSPDLKDKLDLENELYGDIVVLPIKENMNDGKTHAYFSWAHENALVPRPSQDNNTDLPKSAVSHDQAIAAAHAYHDPRASHVRSDWVKPDYVIKTDDDSFVMLAELEARLRVEFHNARQESQGEWDPLVYWGYLIKDSFMGGELYALSWPLVEFVATSKVVRGMTIGAEDKQVAKWVKLHPQASRVRWASERCWIYNHPKSGTVYSHGFLFPSESQRVKKSISGNRTQEEIEKMNIPTSWQVDSPEYSWSSVTGPAPRYMVSHPQSNLTTMMEVEALVEGSTLSWEVSPRRPRQYDAPGSEPTTLDPASQWQRIQGAYDQRETLKERYLGKNLGGTVVVHYLKKDEWFLETSLAFLDS